MSRKGPGLLLAAIAKGDPQVAAVTRMIAAAEADILVLADIDYDHGNATLAALRDAIRAGGGPEYRHLASPRPNSGIDSGRDLDGDGRLGRAADAQGFGRYAGQGGLAILSRVPLRLVADHSHRLWRDMPDSLVIDHAGVAGPDARNADIQRLSSVTHAEYAAALPGGPPLTLMIFHAGPPVFDGPEDRNGRRNHDEVLFWKHRLDGAFGPAPDPPFAILGAANLAPRGGDGRSGAIRALLSDPRLQDPAGLREQPTVTWPAPGPGALRVDYILPSAGLTVTGAGVMAADPKASRHHLIWVDLADHAVTAARDPSGN